MSEKLLYLYGFTRSSWVYCWRCRQAITLEELATTAGYRPKNGWSHATCPPAGSAPNMPAKVGRAGDETPRRWWNDGE